MVYTIRSLVGTADCVSGPDAQGRWSRAIPLQYFGGYLHGAWAVLRGKAVAVRYPVAGELEQALQDTGGIHVSPRKRDYCGVAVDFGQVGYVCARDKGHAGPHGDRA